MTSEEQRREWRIHWLRSLQAYGDTEIQARWWLGPEEHPNYNFYECVSGYLCSAGMGEEDAYAKRYELGYVSLEEIAAVAGFHILADSYTWPEGNECGDAAVVRDPLWQKVAAAARDAREKLFPLLTDENERNVLTRPLKWEWDGEVFRADVGDFSISS